MTDWKLDVEDTHTVAVAPPLVDALDGDVINISGHKQELERIFDPLSTISLAITSGNVWPSLAGSIVSCDSDDSYLQCLCLTDCRNLQWRSARNNIRIVGNAEIKRAILDLRFQYRGFSVLLVHRCVPSRTGFSNSICRRRHVHNPPNLVP